MNCNAAVLLINNCAHDSFLWFSDVCQQIFFSFSNLATCLSTLPHSHIVSQHCFMRQFNSMRHIIRQLGDKFQHSWWLYSFEELDVLVINDEKRNDGNSI